MVAEITDSTNVARAFSFIPITWFLGASIGLISICLFCKVCRLTTSRPLIGGMLERPAEKFPALFGNSSFLQKYPYFLPCFVSAAIAVARWFIVALFFKEVSLLFIKV